MMSRLMVLPAEHFEYVRVLNRPEDMEEHEAYRYATGIIAEVQEDNNDCSREDVADALEEHGFTEVDFILGPELLCRS